MMVLSDYEFVRVVGKGSFGKVYLVKHRRDKKQYCLKIIRLNNVSKKERESCRHEVQILQRMLHPNIVGFKDSFFAKNGNQLCIVMTYCDGGDLYERIKRNRGKPFHETQVLHWFVQMALGLHFMHENHILHRDLKTQNVFLLGNGRLVLGDLGIAKVMTGTADFAKTCIGTPYYMSPELFKNKPYNHKSDVWALGCVLYEMITLKHAFDASSLNGLAVKIMRGRFPPIRGKFSRQLKDLVGRMLTLSPSSRPDLPEILRAPIIKKHVVTFIKDIVERPTGNVGAGTMVVRAAAMNVVHGGGAMQGMTGLDNTDMKQVSNLKKQLERLGMGEVVAQCLRRDGGQRGGASPSSRPVPQPATKGRDRKPRVASRRARELARKRREQVEALQREEERKSAVERALRKLREERELRAKARRRRKEERKRRESSRLRAKDEARHRPRGRKGGKHARKKAGDAASRAQSRSKGERAEAPTRVRREPADAPRGKKASAGDVRRDHPSGRRRKQRVLADQRRVMELDQWDSDRRKAAKRSVAQGGSEAADVANARRRSERAPKPVRGPSHHDDGPSVLHRLKAAAVDGDRARSEQRQKGGAEMMPRQTARQKRERVDRLRQAEKERLRQQKSELSRMRKRLQKHQERVDRERREREQVANRPRKSRPMHRQNAQKATNPRSDSAEAIDANVDRQRKITSEANVEDASVRRRSPESKLQLEADEMRPGAKREIRGRGSGAAPERAEEGVRYSCPPTKDAIAVLRGLARQKQEKGGGKDSRATHSPGKVTPVDDRVPASIHLHPVRRHRRLRNRWWEEQLRTVCGDFRPECARRGRDDGAGGVVEQERSLPPASDRNPLADQDIVDLPGARYTEGGGHSGLGAHEDGDDRSVQAASSDAAAEENTSNAIQELEDLGMREADPSDEEDIDAREEELQFELNNATSRCANLKATLHATDAVLGIDVDGDPGGLAIDTGDDGAPGMDELSSSAKMRAAAASALRRGSPRAAARPPPPADVAAPYGDVTDPHDDGRGTAVAELQDGHSNADPGTGGFDNGAPVAGGKPGGLRERIAIVRRECIVSLGQRRFYAAYDLLKKYLEDQLGHDDAGYDNAILGDEGHEEKLRVLLEDILGDDMAYWGQIDHLIFMEECL